MRAGSIRPWVRSETPSQPQAASASGASSFCACAAVDGPALNGRFSRIGAFSGTVSSTQRISGWARRAGEGMVKVLKPSCGLSAALSICQPCSSMWRRRVCRRRRRRQRRRPVRAQAQFDRRRVFSLRGVARKADIRVPRHDFAGRHQCAHGVDGVELLFGAPRSVGAQIWNGHKQTSVRAIANLLAGPQLDDHVVGVEGVAHLAHVVRNRQQGRRRRRGCWRRRRRAGRTGRFRRRKGWRRRARRRWRRRRRSWRRRRRR